MITAPCPGCGRGSRLTAVDGGLCLYCTDKRHRERQDQPRRVNRRALAPFVLLAAAGLAEFGYRFAAVVVALAVVVWTSFEIGRYFPRRAA